MICREPRIGQSQKSSSFLSSKKYLEGKTIGRKGGTKLKMVTGDSRKYYRMNVMKLFLILILFNVHFHTILLTPVDT